ncbi:MAG: hypothetical protein ACRDYA_14385 [Egibacteraceae bacterium]
MAEITVTRTGPERFGVEVTDGGCTTTHDVTMPPSLMGDLLRLRWVDAEVVVKESFVFLLEREPASGIPPAFSLTDIHGQFPDYYDELHRRLT